MKYLQVILVLLCILIISACKKEIPFPSKRISVATEIAKQNNLNKKIYTSSIFNLLSYSSIKECKNLMKVYIEGDGLSWLTSSTISKNPTPINPMSLKLMTKDTSICKVYLARPCQYVSSNACKSKYWTSHRFSKEVLTSYQEILDQIKNDNLINNYELIGYSGGGTIATLLAANRTDIYSLITVSGNLDIDYWTKKHFLSPLEGSLNPSSYTTTLQNVKQLHLIGGKDTIIDESVFQSYYKRFKNTKMIKHKVYPMFNHSSGWEEEWVNISND